MCRIYEHTRRKYCVVLYCPSYCIVLYRIVSYCIVLYRIVLRSIVLKLHCVVYALYFVSRHRHDVAAFRPRLTPTGWVIEKSTKTKKTVHIMIIIIIRTNNTLTATSVAEERSAKQVLYRIIRSAESSLAIARWRRAQKTPTTNTNNKPRFSLL